MTPRERAQLTDFPEVIETERLRLVRARLRDAEATYALAAASHAELALWMPWAIKNDLEATRIFFATSEGQWHTRETMDFQWMLKASGQLIGKGGFHTVDWSTRKVEIGYWLGTAFTGNGYCAEAVRALAAYARKHGNAARVEITCDALNAKSRAVAERAGFTLEGIHRKARLNVNNDLGDRCMYALVLDD